MNILPCRKFIILTDMTKTEVFDTIGIYTIQTNKRPSFFSYHKGKLFWGITV